MIKMGDEYGHTHNGNNNPWNQDNYINYFHWNDFNTKQLNIELYRFVSKLIKLRKDFDVIHRNGFAWDEDIEWFDIEGKKPDWKTEEPFLAFYYKDKV